MSTLSTRLATALEAKYAAPRAKARSPASAHYHDTFSDCLTGAPEAGDAITDADYRDAMKRGGQLQHSLAAFLDQKYAAIIAAPAPGEAPAILDDSGDPGFRTMWILVGTPGITISTGNQANGMPPGLKPVGAAGEEIDVLATTAWCGKRYSRRSLLRRFRAPH